MVEYGALIGHSFAQQLGNAWYGFVDLVTSFHWGWYVAALVLLFLLAKLLIKR
jgi:hypothetical protein